MRGKKVDNEFLSDFISQCSINDKSSIEDIIIEAQNDIFNIENKIKEVELLKVRRSKLLDVIIIFKEKTLIPKQDKDKLQYFNIKNQHICKFITDTLKDNNLMISSINSTSYSKEDILFCIKQLLEHKIIFKTGDCLVKGINFEEYCNVLLGK